MSANSPFRGFGAFLATLLALSAVVLYWPALFSGQTFAERDLGAFYYAAKWLVAPLAQASGGIPLWNPFFASGQPFAANPEHELFHPMTSLFFVLPFEWAFRLQVMLPPLLAVLCMFWFLRTLGRSRTAALGGGLGWGLGGFALSATNLLPELFTAVPLPLTLGFAVRVYRRLSAANIMGLALCLGLQLLAGEPGTLLAVPPLAAAALLAEPGPPRRSGWLWVLCGLALGIVLGAVVVLPGMHHASKTIRATGLTDSMANEWSMPAIRIFDLFSPHVLGHVDRGNLARYWGRSLYGNKFFAFYYTLYPGLLLSVLALRAWFTRKRAVWVWGGVALLGFLVALGDHFVLWPLLRRVPGFSGLRYPEKAALVFIFPVLVVASHGFDWFMLGGRRARRSLLPILGAVFLGGALPSIAVLVLPSARFPPGDVIPDALRMSGVALAIVLALWLVRDWRRHRRGLLLCGLLCLDLVHTGRELLPTVPIARLATPPEFLAPLVPPGRDNLVFHMAEWNPELAAVGGLAKPPLPARWFVPMTLERDFDFTQLRWTNQSTYAWMETVNADARLIEPLLARRGVTAIVRFAPDVHWEGGHLVRTGGGAVVETLFARETNPFAFAATRVEIVHGVSGWQNAVNRLGSEATRTACVEDDELPSFPQAPGPAEVHVDRTSPMRLAITVDAKGPGPAFVAVNQTWDPGWQASLDDKPTHVYRTDLALSGLIVPPGQHHIELSYHDPWLAAGLVITLATGAACLLLLALARRRRAL